jgi:hypothetical protein
MAVKGLFTLLVFLSSLAEVVSGEDVALLPLPLAIGLLAGVVGIGLLVVVLSPADSPGGGVTGGVAALPVAAVSFEVAGVVLLPVAALSLADGVEVTGVVVFVAPVVTVSVVVGVVVLLFVTVLSPADLFWERVSPAVAGGVIPLPAVFGSLVETLGAAGGVVLLVIVVPVVFAGGVVLSVPADPFVGGVADVEELLPLGIVVSLVVVEEKLLPVVVLSLPELLGTEVVALLPGAVVLLVEEVLAAALGVAGVVALLPVVWGGIVGVVVGVATVAISPVLPEW